MATPPIGLAPQPTRAPAQDLALAGEFAILADPDHPLDSVDSILRRLMHHARADAAELFLAGYGGTEMVLVSHQGRDAGAFCQQDRFRAGEGFPGLALRAGRPIRSDHLDTDGNFIRSRVKALHYRRAACVPFRSGTEVSGCLLLAWRASDASIDQAIRMTTLAAGPIGIVLDLAHARSRIGMLDEVLRLQTRVQPGWRWGEPPPPGAVAVLQVLSSAGRETDSQASTGVSRSSCAAAQGRIQVLGGRSGWPKPCLRAGCVAAARYCVPLIADGTVWGIASVAFRHSPPVPLTRFLPMALWQTEDLRMPDAVDPATAVPRVPPPAAARLEIRCFGGFDVRCEGRSLRHADFGRQKARELLAVLAAAGGRPMAGDRLAEILWPGVNPGQARNRFHVTLSALRRAVEPAGAPDWIHVRRDGRGYFLDPRSPVHVDLWRFDALLRQAASPSTSAAARWAAFEEAVALYEGDAFDAQFSTDWLDGVAHRWREAARRTRERLACLATPGIAPHSPQIN